MFLSLSFSSPSFSLSLFLSGFKSNSFYLYSRWLVLPVVVRDRAQTRIFIRNIIVKPDGFVSNN